MKFDKEKKSFMNYINILFYKLNYIQLKFYIF